MKWRDIEGFANLYQVSDTGLIKSCQRSVINSRFGIQKLKERILKPDFMKDGYLRITLSKNSQIFKYPIHVLVAQAFVDNPDNYNVINHKDEDRSNNNFENLEWCSDQYNLEYSLSRYYIAIDPYGVIHNVFNLSQFCRSHNLSISAMSEMATNRIAKGRLKPRSNHKGWICKYFDNKPIRGVLKHDC